MWPFSGYVPQNKSDAGRWALEFYHERARSFSGFMMSLDQMIAQVGGKHAQLFVDGLGDAILRAEMSEYQVQEAMQKLADQGGGRVPKSQDLFFDALYDRVGILSARDWAAEAPSIAGDSLLQAGEGLAEVGNAAIDLGKSALQFGPLALFLAGAFILYARTRQVAGR